mmetsp:Transcript_4401/g.10669  ORF Transcript_4401/g.10669 Transcript_4401/m.10669 type:complete len:458 (-) Transcript_4401:143-1516(-)
MGETGGVSKSETAEPAEPADIPVSVVEQELKSSGSPAEAGHDGAVPEIDVDAARAHDNSSSAAEYNGSPVVCSASQAGEDAARGSNASGGSRTPSEAASRASLPFNPPESVRKWLREEDWEALKRAWNDAEANAVLWADGDVEDIPMEVWEDESSSAATSSKLGSKDSAEREKQKRRKHATEGGSRTCRRKPWDDNFSVLASDNRNPPSRRRYFDSVPGENSPQKQPALEGLRALKESRYSSMMASQSQLESRPLWNEQWSQLASTDNDGIHPHLRHYFDRRGMEASFRLRPSVDSVWLRQQRPRTPQRPSVKDLLLKHSASAPTLPAASAAHDGNSDPLDVKLRGTGSIRWGRRCLMYGSDPQARGKGKKIPWVEDHHRTETEDNEILNPMLRHYFDADGIETSFRNRGRHYNRPLPAVIGIGGPSANTSVSSMGRTASLSSMGSGSSSRMRRTLV